MKSQRVTIDTRTGVYFLVWMQCENLFGLQGLKLLAFSCLARPYMTDSFKEINQNVSSYLEKLCFSERLTLE